MYRGRNVPRSELIGGEAEVWLGQCGMRSRFGSLVLSFAVCACGSSESTGNEPLTDSGSETSFDASDAGDTTRDCTGVTCTSPGQSCSEGTCVDDCRPPTATPCAAGTVCSVAEGSSGKCVKPTDPCVVTGPTTKCGAISCGPGSLCDGAGGCYAALPCKTTECKGSACWGASCSCTRPPPLCTPAPLGKAGDVGTLNDFAFTRCGPHAPCDGGIQSIDFDQACTAWGVTTISGPDYLRSIDPAGKVTEYTGLTDLDMGEASAVHGKNGEFGTSLKDVALTYTCVCGCTPSSASQQGVAQLELSSGKLPFRIPSKTVTNGKGPFGIPCVDGGPFGLTWGLDSVLYVGNVDTNGDYFAADLAAGTTKLVHTYPNRVHASAPFDKLRMIVALEGGEVWLQPILGSTSAPSKLVTLATHVTSIVRDPWSGRVYAELGDQSIVSFAADGTDVKPFDKAPAQGRIAIAPDGFVYHVTLGWPKTKAEIVRFALPTKL